MLLGLLLGNLIDLDHIYYRMIGKVDWFESACPMLGDQCSIGYYPLHSLPFVMLFSGLVFLLFTDDKRYKLIGWISIGALSNVFLDCIHHVTGIGI